LDGSDPYKVNDKIAENQNNCVKFQLIFDRHFEFQDSVFISEYVGMKYANSFSVKV